MILRLWECTGFRSGIMSAGADPIPKFRSEILSADVDPNPEPHLENERKEGLSH